MSSSKRLCLNVDIFVVSILKLEDPAVLVEKIAREKKDVKVKKRLCHFFVFYILVEHDSTVLDLFCRSIIAHFL